MKCLLPFLLAVFALQQTVRAQDDGTQPFPPPEANHPWVHAKTGLRFPLKLAGMVCEGGVDYVKEAELGQSLRYVNPELRVRADVYVFPCSAPIKTPEEVREAVRAEAGRVLGGIRLMEKRGRYTDIHENRATYEQVDVYPKGSAKAGWLEFSVNATIHEDSAAGESEQKIFSYTGITIHSGYLVKVRCTVPAESNKELDEQVSEFVSQVRFCVFIEPGLRAEMKENISTYHAEPLSEKGHRAAAGLMAYAEKSPMVSVTVSAKMVSLGEGLESVLPDAKAEFTRAFFAGAVGECLREPLSKKLDVEQAGAQEMVRLYQRLKTHHADLKDAGLEALAKAAADGRGGKWLLDDPSAPSKKKPQKSP